MRRRLSALLSALSFLLCVGTCVLWARSDRFGLDLEDFTFVSSDGEVVPVSRDPSVPIATSVFWRVDLLPGRLHLRWSELRGEKPGDIRTDPENGLGLRVRSWPLRPGERQAQVDATANIEKDIRDHGGWSQWGVGFARGPDPTYAKYVGVGLSSLLEALVPCWLLAALFAVLPAAHVAILAHRKLRRRAGLCPACGYDLRASPGRCPECGAEPKTECSERGASGSVAGRPLPRHSPATPRTLPSA